MVKIENNVPLNSVQKNIEWDRVKRNFDNIVVNDKKPNSSNLVNQSKNKSTDKSESKSET